MKNLFTLLLLVVSFLAVGQTNNTSEEIKYWKSIADSDDTVAYREYLNRYGETGLYYDEAITRILLLKTSGKQEQSKNIECCFYTYDGNYFVVRFDSSQSKIWIKRSRNYYTIRHNLVSSIDFYEDQATLALSRKTREYKNAIWADKEAIREAEYAPKSEKDPQKRSEILQKAEHYYKNAWTSDEEYEYDPMKSTSARDVYFKRDTIYQIIRQEKYKESQGYKYSTNTYYVYNDDFDEYIYRGWTNHDDGTYTSYDIRAMHGIRYSAFSKDKSSIIMWFEEDDIYKDGEIINKEEFSRRSKESFLPKPVKYDFLNE